MSICNHKKRGHLVNINFDKKLNVTILYNKLNQVSRREMIDLPGYQI